ncbi:glycosyltransferase family 4 protein [Marinobacter sp. F4216]|uniref:glycosyltransferase family 4 protein n=1 Tax=Marinobacter sp. F4216 TaxID=2874281 RepID=UPI001CBAAAB7|nr:glycosyltransferase family 4 protein [Marinobacter sp. F4216]MBZ2167682.1 glycosyltransferase family 4 protein [Marinobacter sp. F4216]
MSILLLSEIFPPTHGGSGRWFFELYRRLEPSTVRIITHEHSIPEQQEIDRDFPQDIQRIPMKSESWGIKDLKGLGFYLRSTLKIRKLRPEGLSQIHCGRAIPEGFIGLILARMLNKPLVCYVHGEDIETARTSRELIWIVKKVLSGATQLICNSQNTGALLEVHWHVPREKIKVLNPGVDPDRFCPAPEDPEFRAEYGWDSRFVCLTVGRLQRRKGHDMMIQAIPKAVENIPDLLYVIVGTGEQYDHLKRLVIDLKLQHHVQFLQQLDDVDLIRCYQQCDLFILPNRTDGRDIEGFGMVLVEAQASGKPVIAGNSGGTAETMHINKTGLIADCSSPEPIANAIYKLKNSIGKGLFDHKDCRQHVLDHFTWDQHASKAGALFEELGAKDC